MGFKYILCKIMTRLCVGAFIGLSCLPVVISGGSYVLFAYQFVLALTASLVFGVFNPFHSAVEEENIIAVLSVALVPYMLRFGV